MTFMCVNHVSLLVPVGAELLRPGRRLTARRLVLALFNSSLAFFLCSFQVCFDVRVLSLNRYDGMHRSCSVTEVLFFFLLR